MKLNSILKKELINVKFLYPIEMNVFECPICGNRHTTEKLADICIYNHVKERCMNHEWNDGMTLGRINANYGVWLELPEYLENVTKDNCFVISYLQCSDEPIYKISEIKYNGAIHVWGRNKWKDSYSSRVSYETLKNPLPPEDFVDYSS